MHQEEFDLTGEGGLIFARANADGVDNLAGSGVATPAFSHSLVRELLQSAFRSPATQIDDEAVAMMAELMRMFVQETVVRAATEAQEEEAAANQGTAQRTTPVITTQELEKVLAQLILDFS